jgi:hypothetical protein
MRRYLDLGQAPVYNPQGSDEEPDYDENQNAPGFEDEDQQMLREAGPGAVPAANAAPVPIGPGDYLNLDADPWGGNTPGDQMPAPVNTTSAPPAQGHAFAPMPAGIASPDTSPLTKAIQAKQDYLASYPKQTPPKWWERLGAGAFGAAAGWSNAASRTRNPIDINRAQENILHPGYQTALEQWQSKVVPLDQNIQLESEKIGAQYGGLKAQSEAELKRAQAQAAMSHGQYWLNRSSQERNQWKIDPKTGTLFNTVNGTVVKAPPTPKDRYDTAMALGATEQEAKYYALNGKMPNPVAARVPTASTTLLAIRARGGQTGNPEVDRLSPNDAAKAIDVGKDRAPRDPFMDWIKLQNFNEAQQKTLQGIGNTKITEGDQIYNARQAMMDKAFAQPGITEEEIWQDQKDPTLPRGTDAPRVKQLKSINARFAPQLQGVMDNYASAARAHGVPAKDYDIDPNTLQAKERAVQQMPAQRPVPPGQPAPGPVVAPGRGGPVAAPQAPPRIPIQNFPAPMASQLAVGVPRTVRLANGTSVTVVKGPDGKVYPQ